MMFASSSDRATEPVHPLAPARLSSGFFLPAGGAESGRRGARASRPPSRRPTSRGPQKSRSCEIRRRGRGPAPAPSPAPGPGFVLGRAMGDAGPSCPSGPGRGLQATRGPSRSIRPDRRVPAPRSSASPRAGSDPPHLAKSPGAQRPRGGCVSASVPGFPDQLPAGPLPGSRDARPGCLRRARAPSGTFGVN